MEVEGRNNGTASSAGRRKNKTHHRHRSTHRHHTHSHHGHHHKKPHGHIVNDKHKHAHNKTSCSSDTVYAPFATTWYPPYTPTDYAPTSPVIGVAPYSSLPDPSPSSLDCSSVAWTSPTSSYQSSSYAAATSSRSSSYSPTNTWTPTETTYWHASSTHAAASNAVLSACFVASGGSPGYGADTPTDAPPYVGGARSTSSSHAGSSSSSGSGGGARGNQSALETPDVGPKTIAAATVGGVVGLAALAVGVLFAVRKHRRGPPPWGGKKRYSGGRAGFYGLGGAGARSELSDASDNSILAHGPGPFMTESGFILGAPPTESSVDVLASHGHTSKNTSPDGEPSFVPPARRGSRTLSQAESDLGLAITTDRGAPLVTAGAMASNGVRRAATADPYHVRRSSAPLSVRNPDLVRSDTSDSDLSRRAPRERSSTGWPSTAPYLFMPPGWAARHGRGSTRSSIDSGHSTGGGATLGHPHSRSTVGLPLGSTWSLGTTGHIQNTPHSVDNVVFGNGDYFARPR